MFEVGTPVAIVTTNRYSGERSIRRSRVSKVHKTGRFLVEGLGELFTPSRSGLPQAFPRYSHSSVHVELWTGAIECEIEARNRTIRQMKTRDALIARIQALRPVHERDGALIDELMALVERHDATT